LKALLAARVEEHLAIVSGVSARVLDLVAGGIHTLWEWLQ